MLDGGLGTEVEKRFPDLMVGIILCGNLSSCGNGIATLPSAERAKCLVTPLYLASQI